MPIYEYECTDCGHRTEVLQRLSDPPLEACPECGKPVRRLVSAPAFQFKGTGWYATDYAGKGKKDEKPQGEGDSKSPSKESGESSGGSEGSGSSKTAKSTD